MSTLYEYYYDGESVASVYGANWRAQTFTPSISHTITGVRLPLERQGLPGTFTVSIRATDGAGKPTGADLCSASINGNLLPGLPAWQTINFGTSYPLIANTKYAIVGRAPSGSSSVWVGWAADVTSPAYSGGSRANSSDSGSSWTLLTTWDFQFEEWGDPIEAIQQAVSGALSFEGSLLTSLIRVVSKGGSLSPAGTLSRSISKNTQGNLSFVGITHLYTFKSLAGTLSTAGVLAKMTQKAVSGALSFVGDSVKLTQKIVDGAISPAGDLTKNIYKNVLGALTPSGAITASKIFIQSVGGGLSFAGAVATEIITATKQAVGGVLSFVGDVSLIRSYVVNLAGYLSSAGEVVKQTSKNLAGGLTPSGVLSAGSTILVAIGGTLTLAGSLVRNMSKNMVGLIMPVGIVSKYTRKLMHGTLSFTGSLKKMTSKIVSGILSLVGAILRPGRDLVMRLSHRPYRDMSVKSKPHRNMNVETKDE